MPAPAAGAGDAGFVEELGGVRLHARAGLARELSDTDLKEMLMLVAIYAGVPVANTAFAQARRLIEEAGRQEHQM
ncbi:MAG: carboxymuconolactone decarboxylase family protein [Burkholderiales bacterium]